MADTIETAETETSNTATAIAQTVLIVGLAAAAAVTSYKIVTHFVNKDQVLEDDGLWENDVPTPKKTTKKTTE